MTETMTTPTEATSESDRETGRRKVNGADAGHVRGRKFGPDGLIAAVLRVVTEEGVGYRAAAARVLSDTPPDPHAAERWLIIGLAADAASIQYRVNFDDLPQEKDERAQFLGRFQLGTRHANVRDLMAMERIRLQGADGQIKLLADFGIKDAIALAGEAKAEQVGAQKRERFAHELEAMLTKHKAATWRKLPAAVQRTLDKYAAGAWS